MAKSKKFYVVWKGVQPGIYDNWEEASLQVQGFTGAQYKSFSSKKEAETAFKGSFWSVAGQSSGTTKLSHDSLSKVGVNLDALAVDAACSGNPGPMEYRGVHIKTGNEIFRIGPLDDGTNNIGEFLALVHGLAWLKQQGSPKVPIYTDSRNAQSWIKAKTCRTKLERSGRNDKIFELIERAEAWLAKNPVTNPIIKWETDQWGEIPADFGRK
jgi:ribonuclease HI